MVESCFTEVFDVVKPRIMYFMDLFGLGAMACVSKKFEAAVCDNDTLRSWLPAKWFQRRYGFF
jgi:hypothetical protein